jgi:hypothetical protein
MRAKVAVVALVAGALMGLTAPGAYASRGDGKDGGGGHDNGQHDNKYDHSCTTNDRNLVGNVCVIVSDLPILGKILSM